MSGVAATVVTMNDLVPEKRVDKNGVLNTKLVRPVTMHQPLSTLFPSPTLRRQDFVIADGTVPTMDIVELQVTRLPENVTEDEIRSTLATLSQQTPVMLDALRMDAKVINRAVMTSLRRGNFALVNNMAVLGAAVSKPALKYLDHYCAGIHQCGAFAPDLDLSKSGEQEIESAVALVRATEELSKGYGIMYATHEDTIQTLSSTQLALLITQRPKDTDRIIAILRERDLPVETEDDMKHIIQLLETPVHALTDGAL